MIRLLGAEVRRWAYRRGLWFLLLGVAGLTLLVSYSAWAAAAPPPPEQIAAAKQNFEESLSAWNVCAEGETDAAAVAKCGHEKPELENYMPANLNWKFTSEMTAFLSAGLGAFTAMMMAASFWGAEYRHGTLGTWLTFAPSRTRVWASRTAVAMLAGALVSFVISVIALGNTWLAFFTQQGASAVADWGSALQVAGRGVALAALLAGASAAMAILFRNTIAAVALPLIYLFLQGFMGLLTGIPGIRWLVPFLPEVNVMAFLSGGVSQTVRLPSEAGSGFVEYYISMEHGLVYLLVVAGMSLLFSAIVFQRRDVTD